MIEWGFIDDWLMINWLLLDDWLMIDWWLIDDWLMIDWWFLVTFRWPLGDLLGTFCWPLCDLLVIFNDLSVTFQWLFGDRKKTVFVTYSPCLSLTVCLFHKNFVSVRKRLCHIQSVSARGGKCLCSLWLTHTVCLCLRQYVSAPYSLCLLERACFCHRQCICVIKSLWLIYTVCVCHRQSLSGALIKYYFIWLLLHCVGKFWK